MLKTALFEHLPPVRIAVCEFEGVLVPVQSIPQRAEVYSGGTGNYLTLSGRTHFFRPRLCRFSESMIDH